MSSSIVDQIRCLTPNAAIPGCGTSSTTGTSKPHLIIPQAHTHHPNGKIKIREHFSCLSLSVSTPASSTAFLRLLCLPLQYVWIKYFKKKRRDACTYVAKTRFDFVFTIRIFSYNIEHLLFYITLYERLQYTREYNLYTRPLFHLSVRPCKFQLKRYNWSASTQRQRTEHTYSQIEK